MKANITDAAIARAKADAVARAERVELTDARHPGLRLLITPPSKRTPIARAVWYLGCRDRTGRARRYEIGEYGTPAPRMGIAEAREAARTLRHRVRNEGADPIADRKRDRKQGQDARAGLGTLKAEIDFYEAGRGSNLKSWSHSRKRVDLVFRELMERPALTLTARDFQEVADAYPAAPSASFAVRTIRPALRWLEKRGRVHAECATISQPETVRSRQRVLSREELARLLPVLIDSDKPHAAVLRLLLLTAVRLNEACTATWGQIDWRAGTWTMTVKNTKPHVVAERTHTVALSKQARALLEARKPAKPDPANLIFATESGKPLGNWDRAGKAIQAASNTEGWHRHDLRRTAATLLGRLGTPPHVIEAVLAHSAISSRLAATYNVARYEKEAAAALQALADELDLIAAESDAAVKPARPKRSARKRKAAKSAAGAQPPEGIENA